MKRYTASELRARLSEALDEVERGGEVTVDRGKRTFRIIAAAAPIKTSSRRRRLDFEVIDERSKLLASSVAAVATGPQTVTAEMPGKVVKVHVAVGAQVCERQGIVIVEAMKMENEIPSPIDGTVREIAVAEGQTVEAGATLFVVEPPPAA